MPQRALHVCVCNRQHAFAAATTLIASRDRSDRSPDCATRTARVFVELELTA
jgi:hypothetical protein